MTVTRTRPTPNGMDHDNNNGKKQALRDDALTPRRAEPPMRTCVICRGRFPKATLNRHVCPRADIAETGEGLVPDPEQILPGRGFYVCTDSSCGKRFGKFQGWRRKCKGERYDSR
ncbi:MAG: YlxR family protein [Desulfovibrionaceae bacterium]